MSITYTWDAPHGTKGGNVGDLTNVIQEVHIRRWGESDDGIRWDENVVVRLEAPRPDRFKPLDQLTPDEVASWVEHVLGAEGMAALDQRIAEDIDRIRAERGAVLTPPWQRSAAEEEEAA